MTSISEFYAGRSIFITGATGFVGKVLVEKLLRSCPTIKALYLLVRPKKGHAPKTRIEQILQTKLFEKVAGMYPDFRAKVFPMTGDVLEPVLGLSEKDIETLNHEVSIVFHAAATIRFNEQLKLSIQMNVLGVREIIRIANNMEKLEAFIHVSTAYANCNRDEILESVYPPSIHPSKILDSVDWMSEKMLDTLTPSMVDSQPNTYTYTKSLAEFLIVNEAKDFHVAIVRPSIICASWQEPFPGWVDNFNGPTGILAAIGKGVLRIMHGDLTCMADIIPVDMVTNLMISAAWSTAIERLDTIKVYNCTTGGLNPITWEQIGIACDKFFKKNPLDDIIRVPSPQFTTSYTWLHLNKWFNHWLPAWTTDLLLKLGGRRPVLARLQKRLWKSVSYLEYFTSKEWYFSNQNMIELLGKLSESDKKDFNFDVKEIHWMTYMENYCMGIKKYVLKEEVSQMPKARRNLQRILLRNRFIKTVMYMILMRFLITRVAVVRGVWDFLLTWVLRILKRLPMIARS